MIADMRRVGELKNLENAEGIDDDDQHADCKSQTRKWRPGGKVVVTTDSADATDDDGPHDGAAPVVDESHRAFQSAKDGTAWRVELAHEPDESDDGDGNYHQNGFIEVRSARGKIRNVTPEGRVISVVGIETGGPWVITADDQQATSLARWDAAKSKWIAVAIPRPPSASPKKTTEPTVESIFDRGDGSSDVWISVTYGVLPPDPNTPEGKKALKLAAAKTARIEKHNENLDPDAEGYQYDIEPVFGAVAHITAK